jgi:phosphocarrier protein HPr
LTFALFPFSIKIDYRLLKERKVIPMKTVQISLNSIDKVKSFVNDITRFDYDFDLVSGRYVIDAKSIMGIFSLDLSKPIDLNIHAEDNVDEVLDVLKPYII